jgi:hypothetical protein
VPGYVRSFLRKEHAVLARSPAQIEDALTGKPSQTNLKVLYEFGTTFIPGKFGVGRGIVVRDRIPAVLDPVK